MESKRAEDLKKGDVIPATSYSPERTVRSVRPYRVTVVVRWFESKTPSTYSKDQLQLVK